MTVDKMQNQATDEELDVYEKIRQKVSKAFVSLQHNLNTETIAHALNKAIHEVKEAGEHSLKSIDNASTALKKDIVSSTRNLKPKFDEFTEEAGTQFDNWFDKGGALWHDIVKEAEHVQEYSRDKGGALLSNVLRGLGDWSKTVSETLDTSLKYRTGETSHGGEFICTSCGNKIHLKQPGRIPPCPGCSKTEFRRS